MANRRTVHTKISVSGQVSRLSDLAALAYTWAILHCDDWGAIHGEPFRFKGTVLPLRSTVKRIGEAIDEMVREKLVVRYAVAGEVFLWLPGFDKHQDGLHKRTTKHRLPMPWQAPKEAVENLELAENHAVSGEVPELPGTSGKPQECPPEGKGREGKGTETKGKVPASPDAAPRKREKKPECALDLSDLSNGQRELAEVILPILDGWLGESRLWTNAARRNWVRDSYAAIHSEEFTQEDLVRWLSDKETRPKSDRIAHPEWWWGKCQSQEERANNGGPLRLPVGGRGVGPFGG